MAFSSDNETQLWLFSCINCLWTILGWREVARGTIRTLRRSITSDSLGKYNTQILKVNYYWPGTMAKIRLLSYVNQSERQSVLRLLTVQIGNRRQESSFTCCLVPMTIYLSSLFVFDSLKQLNNACSCQNTTAAQLGQVVDVTTQGLSSWRLISRRFHTFHCWASEGLPPNTDSTASHQSMFYMSSFHECSHLFAQSTSIMKDTKHTCITLLWLLALCLGITSSSDKQIVTIGVILPFEHKYPWAISKTLPAIQYAVDTQNNKSATVKFEVVVGDSQCSDTYGPLQAIDWYLQRTANVFVGPACDYSVAPIARFSPHWNIPVITGGALVHAFSDKNQYRQLTRISGSYAKLGEFFTTLFDEFSFINTALIYNNNLGERVKYGRDNCYFVMEAVFLAIKKRNKDLYNITEDPWSEAFDEKQPGSYNMTTILKEASLHARSKPIISSFHFTLNMSLPDPTASGHFQLQGWDDSQKQICFGFTEGRKVSTKWNHYNLSVPYPKGKYIQRFFISYIVIPLQKVNGDLLQV